MEYLTKEQRQSEMQRFLKDVTNSHQDLPFFYPNRGIEGIVNSDYKIRIIKYEKASYKHYVNKNYVPCAGEGSECVHCTNKLPKKPSMLLTIEVLGDPRMNSYSQRSMHLRWEIKSELSRVIASSIEKGIDIYAHPFKLIILKKKNCDKPHYQLSRFLLNESFCEDNEEPHEKADSPHDPPGQASPSITANAVTTDAKIQPSKHEEKGTPIITVMTDQEAEEIFKNLVFTEEEIKSGFEN